MIRKIIGFKLMLGEWANEIENKNDLLYFHVTKNGVGTVGDERLMSTISHKLPENKMSNYDPKTTIMSFKFIKKQIPSNLPEFFMGSANGIIKGESNLEIIWERKKGKF